MLGTHYTVGLTGGIGSGKTAASDWFASKNITIVDADIIARSTVEKGSDALNTIVNEFGAWVLTENGDLNRTALRDYIFKTPTARKILEDITHPAIRYNIIDQLAHSTSPFTILVVPLLFEGGEDGLVSLCSRTLVVDVPVEIQKKRASQRDSQTLEQINNIINTQITREKRLELADDIVDNSKNKQHLYQQLEPLYQHYIDITSK